MSFKLIISISSLLSIVQAGLITQANTYTIATPVTNYPQQEYRTTYPAIATTQQNVVRAFDGTISGYPKAIDTPYPSVYKQDNRIIKDLFTPSLSKTVNYALPASQVKTAPTVATFYTQNASPVVYSQPLKVISPSGYSQLSPAVTKKIVTKAATPVVATFNHVPAVTSYSHEVPVGSGYASAQSVLYSPAEKVSHISFDGFGTHWGA